VSFYCLITGFIILSISNLAWSFPTTVSVLKDERTQPGKNGTFSYEIVLTDGTMIRQSGSLDKDDAAAVEEALVIRGEYTFIDPKGHAHTVTYVADKNGTF
jgi:hypothetical protein